jgi:hypothetical protein
VSRLLKCIALALPCFIASVAHAESTDALDQFRNLCVARNADADSIVLELDVLGWRALSAEELTDQPLFAMARGFTMHWNHVAAWEAPDDANTRIIFLGSGPLGGGQAVGDFCLLAAPAPYRGQLRRVVGWLGGDSFESWGPAGEVFRVMRNDAGDYENAARSPDSQVTAALQQGQIAFVQVIGDTRGSSLNFSVVRSAEVPDH